MDSPFEYHVPDGEQQRKLDELVESFTALNLVLEHICPDSRARSVAFTHLETAAMWAKKSVFHRPIPVVGKDR